MNARKLLASAAAAATVMGGITLAYAQTGSSDAPMNPPTQANQAPGTAGMTGANNTLSNANTPSTAPNSAPTYNSTTPNTTTTQATDSMPAPQADRG